MSIASEITRINGNIAAAYTALDGKGATLPEVQNSANLADTIDTITTGGGGGDGYRPSIYSTIEQLTFAPTYGVTTYGELRELGYVYTNPTVNYSDSGTLTTSSYTGILYGEELRGLTLYKKGLSNQWVLCGSGVTMTALDENYNYNTVYSFTFANTGDLYIIIGSQSGNQHGALSISSTSTSLGCDILSKNSVEFIAYNYLGSGYNEQNPSSHTMNNEIFGWQLPKVKDISLKNAKLTMQNGADSSHEFSPASYAGAWLTHNPFMSAKKKASLFSNMSYQDTCYMSTSNVGGFFDARNNRAWIDFANFPYALDLSQYTSAASISEFYVGGYYASTSPSVKRAFIPNGDFFFIPHSNWNINWQVSVGNQWDAPAPSKDSIEYFAAHCPTVSNKTFKVGSYALATLEVLCPTALATIRSKGYTIS